jgi:hypothetical protein
MERFVSVQELCRILAVSRSRLYALTRDGILPAPMRNPSNGRPIYTHEHIERCREVFKTHIGVNGHPYMPNTARGACKSFVPQRHRHESLITSLAALGITATVEQVTEAVRSLPKGLDDGELVKQVFLRLRHAR